MRRRRGRMVAVLQIKRANDEDDDGIVVIIIIIARCRQQALAGACHAITPSAAFIAVYQDMESITLAGAVMAILHAPVALGRRKANRSISKETRQAAADRET